ncbi:MAG: fatty acid desaturase [Cyanobacteria bacterium]|nr:fatty acid desaturase [Cyanobacteriota bacterium]
MIEFTLAFLISYLLHILGIAIGYHRLLSHRSFNCPKAVEYFWVGAGYLGFQSSPLWWATMHRAHHRYSDTALDPHAGLHGWRRSIYGWIFDETYPENLDPRECAPDLASDPVYKFLDQGGRVQRAHLLNGMLCFLTRFVVLYFFGLPAALGSLAAGLFMQQVTLIFNKISHIPQLGYRNHETTDDSVNIPWLAIVTMGEGWHNNHHAAPGSATNTLKKGELDPSYWVIKAMKTVGLVSWVNNYSLDRLHAKKQMAMEPVIESIMVEPAPEVVCAGDRR